VTKELNRRKLITLISGAAVAWSTATRAQQPPVIGFLHGGAPAQNADRLAGFRKGLRETGFVEGQNVDIEFRWAEGQTERLPELAADLVRRQVAVIATLSASQAAVAAKAATGTIPIVFQVGSDPIAMGLVTSLSRPGGNATGISTLNAEITEKRIGLLRELVPQAAVIGVLVNPTNPSAGEISRDVRATAVGVQLQILPASTDSEIEAAFAAPALQRSGALVVSTDPLFFIRRAQLAALAARNGPHDLLRPAIRLQRRLDELRNGQCECMAAGGNLCEPYPQGRKTGRPPGRAGGEIRNGHQPQDRQDARR
jgi:putative tryptophan/tyrosine transport system substrate-binding protein